MKCRASTEWVLIMDVIRRERGGHARLEAFLVLAFVVLVLQVFPALWFGLWWVVDVRHWSRGAWMGLNVAIVLTLFGVRFIPALYQDWRERRNQLTLAREKRQMQLEAKEHRLAIERVRRGRSRRMY